MYHIHFYSGFSALPERYHALLKESAERGFFSDPQWLELLVMHDLDEQQDTFRLYAVDKDQRPQLLFPICLTRRDTAAPGAQALASVSHGENYTELSLLFADDPELDKPAILAELFQYLKSQAEQNPEEDALDILRLSPFEQNGELDTMLIPALKQAGFWVQTYINSFNYFEDTTGMDYDRYLSGRSANLRYNIRRRNRYLEKTYSSVEFDLYDSEHNLPQGVAHYITVADASWKTLLSMISDSMLDLIQLAAVKGCLRLGVLRLDDKPVASQLWIISGGIAYCLRLAYDEAYKNDAAGVVLTSRMIAHFLDRDRVRGLDFGYGEEAYKGTWMKSSRHYRGVIAFNPSTGAGRYHGLRHILGRPVKRSLKWLIKRAWTMLRAPGNQANNRGA